jgi:hypothetical protein
MDELAFLETLRHLAHNPDRKHAYFDLCAVYAQVELQQREYLCSEWVRNYPWTIPLARAILLADPYPSEQRLRACLISLSHFPSGDYRDDLVVICPLYHSAVHLGMDPQHLFEEIAAISAASVAPLVHEFWQRTEVGRALKAFGYQEERTPDGVYFANIQQQSVEETAYWMEAFLRRPLTDEDRAEIVASRRKGDRYTHISPKG